MRTELSRRERQVLLLTAQGLNGPQIAKKLNLSRETIKAHKKNIMAKLGVGSMLQAVVMMMDTGTEDSLRIVSMERVKYHLQELMLTLDEESKHGLDDLLRQVIKDSPNLLDSQ